MRPSFTYQHSPFASRVAASHRGAVPDQRVKFRRHRCDCAHSTARSSQVALLILLGIHCSTLWMLIQLYLISSAAHAMLQGHACSVQLQTGRSNAIFVKSHDAASKLHLASLPQPSQMPQMPHQRPMRHMAQTCCCCVLGLNFYNRALGKPCFGVVIWFQ